jgi:spoIIIJ-associated protein
MLECKGKTVDEAVFSGLVKMDLSIDEVKIEILDEGGGLFKSAKVRLTKKTEEDIKIAVAAQQEERQKSEEPSFSPREHRDRRDNGHRRDRRHDGPRRDKRDNYRRENREYRGSREEVVLDADFTPQEPANDAEKFLLGLFDKMGIQVRLASTTEDGILKVDMSGRGMGMLIGRRGETLDALQYLTSLVVNNSKEDYTKVMLDTEDYRKKREDTLRRLAARLADKVQKSGKRVVLEPMNPYERRILHSTLQDYDKVYTYSEGEDPFRSVVVALKGSEDEPQAQAAKK